MARLTLARKIATITLAIGKKHFIRLGRNTWRENAAQGSIGETGQSVVQASG